MWGASLERVRSASMKRISKRQDFGVSPILSTGARPMTNLHAPDPLIVDTKNDLNVYLTAAEDGTSCCGTDAEKASSCCNAEMQARCCKPEQKESCCQSSSPTCGCQDKTSMASDAKKLAASLGIMDFNEWAGTNIVSSPYGGSRLIESKARSKSMPSSL